MTINDVRADSRGLLVTASAPLQARIARAERLDDRGYAAYFSVTVEIPGAVPAPDLPRQSAWEKGVFSAARVSRYASDTECGTRLRLEARRLGRWTIEPRGNRILITAPAAAGPGSILAEGREFGEEPASGAVHVYAQGALTSQTGYDASTTTQLQLGVAQRLPGVGELRGFVSNFTPDELTSAPYRAIALAGVRLGEASVDVAAGDLQATLGDATGSTAILPNALTIRGGGATVFLPKGFTLQAFGGRAAYSGIIRLPDMSSVISDISPDHVRGLQAVWVSPTQRFGAGAGWILSLPVEGPTQQNYFGSFLFQEAERYMLQLLLESSRGEESGTELSGWAATIQPAVNTERLNIDGYFRYTTPDFRPPLGANFFAGLRQSANLNVNYRPIRSLSLSASAGQGKTFNYFDPADVGTVSTSESVGVSYQYSDWLNVAAFAATSTSKSDPGALNPSDSRTNSASVAVGTTAMRGDASISYSRDWTESFMGAAFDTTVDRVYVDAQYSLSQSDDLIAQLRYYDWERAGAGGSDKNYGGALEYRSRLRGGGTLSAILDYGITPAGVSLYESRQVRASLGFQTGPAAVFGGQLACRASYYRLDLEGLPSHAGWFAQVNLGTLFGWGREPRPMAPGDSRAMNLAQTRRQDLDQALLDIRVFEDRNGDGRMQPDEVGIADVRVQLDGGYVVTDEDGAARARLREGRYQVDLVPQGPVLDFVAPDPNRTIAVSSLERRAISYPLRPACRISGRVEFPGAPAQSTATAGVALTLAGAGPERGVVSGKDGAFQFGLLPVGTYAVALDVATLPPGTAVEGPVSIEPSCRKGDQVQLTFTIRKATARERFLVDTGEYNQ
ncbi:MAG: hypothetical protein MUF27_11550 [Acidobacteria bacterium]|nr:hypothetical protein [Acidobacteriota bacterium]